MSRVWPQQSYKAAFNSAIVAAEAYRDDLRLRFSEQRKNVKYPNARGHVFSKARFENRLRR